MILRIRSFINSSHRTYIIVGLIVTVIVSLGMYLNYTSALTATLLPSSTEANAWTAGTVGCTTFSSGHTCVDEGPSANTTDYVATGTSLGTGISTTFPIADQANVGTATNITVYYYAKSTALNGNAPNADTITMNLEVGGAQVGTASVQSMTTSFAWYSAQYSGNWTQADVNNMKTRFTRTVVGGGNQNNADDDVQISSVYVSMIYTSPVNISQVAYRWFGAEKTRAAGVFNSDVEYATAANPRGVVTGDFNADQQADVVSANVQADSISVLLGNGDGTLDAKVDYTTADGPNSIVAGDFNKDQKLDVITANINNATISVLLGNGDGTFGTKVDYPSQTVVGEIAVGDLDGDQNLDIVTTSQVLSQYAVYMGNGDGTFDARVNTSASDFRGIALADFNGDQRLDMVAANLSTDAVSVVLGNGDGTFGAKVDYPTADLTQKVAIGDFNNDQKIDIVSGSQTHTAISVLLGNGDGTFGTKVDYPAGTGSAALQAIDVNGDSFTDIVSVIDNNGDTAVAVLKGNGNGTFNAKVNYLVAGDPYAAASGDLNVDGAPDLIVANNGSGTVSVLLNTLDYPALGGVNNAVVAPTAGTNFRLRVNLGVTGADMNTGTAFKLRYLLKEGGSCSANPSAYSDVSTSTPIQFYDAAALLDHSSYVSTDLDPIRSGITATGVSYDESNPFTATLAVFNGRDGLWDFSLATAAGLTPAATYCLMISKSNNAALDSYVVIPEITIPTPTIEQSNHRFYGNTNSLTPGAPLAPQNTKPSVAVGSEFRLRQLLLQTNDLTPIGASFKLQAAEKITSCSAGVYSTLSATASPSSDTSTGFQQTAASVVPATGSAGVWVAPFNAVNEDGLGAQFYFTGRPVASTPITASQFGFNIPDNATIKGIEFKYKIISSAEVGEQDVYLVKNGSTPVGTDAASLSMYTNNTAYTKGNPSSLWGTTWTPAEINNTGFGVQYAAWVWADGGAEPPAISIDYLSLNVHYLAPATVSSFTDNLAVGDDTAVGATVSDPTAVGGTVLQAYSENQIFTTLSPINKGQSGLWDFSLRADESLQGKTYCFRVVKNDNGLLANYAQYPEVTFTAAGPTLSQQLRGGQSVVGGVKRPFNW